MAHTSPATYLVWSILAYGLGGFLVFHLWMFDRFRCLRWNNGPSGNFKRFMTYTYIISIPLIMAYASGYAVIKYKMGYSIIPGYGIIPTPWQLWPKGYRDAIFPLQLFLSVGWGLELMTHLEELCFWLFLLNAGSVQQDWFRSMYFKTWAFGSIVAVIYMPLVTIFTRSDPFKCEAFSFLSGSLGDLSLTLWFIPVLWTFPSFLANLRKEGVDTSTLVRLTTFYELNAIRVFFRFLFVIPLLILGVDGVRPHQHINVSRFWTELLAIIAGIGCVVSSGITLIIFFPRNRESEINAKYASRQDRSAHMRTFQSTHLSEHESMFSPTQSFPLKSVGFQDVEADPFAGGEIGRTEYDHESGRVLISGPSSDRENQPVREMEDINPQTIVSFSPNRRLEGGRMVEGGVQVTKLTEENKLRHDRRAMANVNPIVHNFTSPIDLVSGVQPHTAPRGPRQRR